MCLVRNYRLQDIQLSKIGDALFCVPFQLLSAASRCRLA